MCATCLSFEFIKVTGDVSKTRLLHVPSSANFDQADIGKPILDVVVEAGDLLYFPRGFIHQGNCLPDTHSMHITISSFQKNSWGDLMQKVNHGDWLGGKPIHIRTELLSSFGLTADSD